MGHISDTIVTSTFAKPCSMRLEQVHWKIMSKLPDSGFIALIDKLKQERAQQVVTSPAPTKKVEMMAITEDGQVMPLRVWAKRWSDKHIDGRHGT